MSNHYNRTTQKQISLENQQSIKDLTEKVTSLEISLNETNDNVKRMLFYFNSDSDTKSEGFIEKSNRHDAEIKEIKGIVDNVKFSAKITSSIFGAIAGILTFIILMWKQIKG